MKTTWTEVLRFRPGYDDSKLKWQRAEPTAVRLYDGDKLVDVSKSHSGWQTNVPSMARSFFKTAEAAMKAADRRAPPVEG